MKPLGVSFCSKLYFLDDERTHRVIFDRLSDRSILVWIIADHPTPFDGNNASVKPFHQLVLVLQVIVEILFKVAHNILTVTI